MLELDRLQQDAGYIGQFDLRLVFGDDAGLPAPEGASEDEDRWDDLRDKALIAIFGDAAFAANREFEQAELPDTSDDAVIFAAKHGFDILIDGQAVRDWFLFSVMIAASARGLTRWRPHEIERRFEDSVREKLVGVREQADGWLAANDPHRPVLSRTRSRDRR